MNEKEITERLHEFTKSTACFGDSEYPIEFCKMKISELYHLLIVNEGNTGNVLSEIKELKKWSPAQSAVYDKMDSLYRWQAVDFGRQLISFEVQMPLNDEGIKTIYLLLNIHESGGEKGCYVGLKFNRNYK